jgi:hypothetical protein
MIAMVLGATGAAWACQHLGFSLGVSLVVFVVAIPVLWGPVSLVLGFVLMRALDPKAAACVGELVEERVAMTARDDGLEITRDSATAVVPWAAVQAERLGTAGGLVVHLEESGTEPYLIARHQLGPGATDEGWESFCAEVLRHAQPLPEEE